MKLEQQSIQSKWHQLSSISTIDPSNSLLPSEAGTISKHKVPVGYLILSKNDFEKVPTRVNIGYFNKKTNYLIGEENSLVFYDNFLKKIQKIPTSVAIAEPKRYFLIMNLAFIDEVHNKSCTITENGTQKKTTVFLDYEFGASIGDFLLNENSESPELEPFMKSIIQGDIRKRKLNKQLLSNSNKEFLCGILDAYVQGERCIKVRRNLNLYNFIYILNFLGAQYTIRSIETDNNQESTKHIYFRLPIQLGKVSHLDFSFFRTSKYIMIEDKLKLQKNIMSLPVLDNSSLENQVNSGSIEMIPMKDLVLLRSDNQIMYDYTMKDPDSNNFASSIGPVCSNSDGDVLSCTSILSEDASREASKAFGVEQKTAFQDLKTGKVQNHMIKLDAQLGLYNALK